MPRSTALAQGLAAQPAAKPTVRMQMPEPADVPASPARPAPLVLPSPEDGTLYFHLTASRAADGTGTEMDLQNTNVTKGQGEFTLLHGMSVPGSFHLSLIGKNGDRQVWYADQYFGTGDNVYRKK